MLYGNQCLMVTPFTTKRDLDEASTVNLVEFLIKNGTHGIIAMGSTGEFFSLTPDERKRLMDIVIEAAKGTVPVSFCCGHSGTDIAIDLAQYASNLGTATILIPPPYYAPNFFATSKGLFAHFKAIAESVEIPIMLYDGGSGIEIPLDLMAKLVAECRNVRYVKITTPSPTKVSEIKALLSDKLVPFCGNDALTLLMLAYGAQGMTLGVGNVLPRETSKVYEYFTGNRINEARELFYRKVLPMISIALSSSPEFIQCFKQTLAWQGVIASPTVRRPLQPLDERRKQELKAVLKIIGALK